VRKQIFGYLWVRRFTDASIEVQVFNTWCLSLQTSTGRKYLATSSADDALGLQVTDLRALGTLLSAYTHWPFHAPLIVIRHRWTGVVLRQVAAETLAGADLKCIALAGADLRGMALREADLRGTDLRGADLREADLQGANLQSRRGGFGWWVLFALLILYLEFLIPPFSPGFVRAMIGLFSVIAILYGALCSTSRTLRTRLTGAELAGADLSNARYDRDTRWPKGFDPECHGAILVR
jgi:hypothetical protein